MTTSDLVIMYLRAYGASKRDALQEYVRLQDTFANGSNYKGVADIAIDALLASGDIVEEESYFVFNYDKE